MGQSRNPSLNWASADIPNSLLKFHKLHYDPSTSSVYTFQPKVKLQKTEMDFVRLNFKRVVNGPGHDTSTR